MCIKVILKQKGLTKRKICIQEIASLLDLSYGIKDKHDCLDEDQIGKDTVLYNNHRLARGINVEIDNYDVLLTLYLPTSHDEIDLFYRLIEKICELLQKQFFIKNDELYHLEDIPICIKEDTILSKDVLNSIYDKLVNHEIDQYVLFGVMQPIYMGLKEFKEIRSDLNRLEEYLDRLQSIDISYAKPHIYKRKDNSLFGGYFIGEDIETIIPIDPNILNEVHIEDWYVFFPEKKIMDYDFFISHINTSYYDHNHGIICLSRNDVNELFDKKYDSLNTY